VTHAAAKHRRMDAELTERLARDGGNGPAGGTIAPVPVGALLPSRFRLQDLRTMSRPKVLLAKLSVHTSAKGREYLSGFLGKASVVGFKGEPDRFGNPCWNIFVSEPEPREGATVSSHGEWAR
jgi:hypothetical protein